MSFPTLDCVAAGRVVLVGGSVHYGAVSPGEALRVTVTVTDSAGTPVGNAAANPRFDDAKVAVFDLQVRVPSRPAPASCDVLADEPYRVR
jgi:hypothetical protein